MLFKEFPLLDSILSAVDKTGYSSPTPIQSQAIPALLEGMDLLGIAQTGTGKTAAFALPILDRLARDKKPTESNRCRALILTPTRELAAQIQKSFETYGSDLDLRSTVIFGGVHKNPQVKAMNRGQDVLIATPGRLLDLMKQKVVVLDQLEVFVLDEADRMLDMGFIHDVRKIVSKLPKKRQTLLFSATMPRDIEHLAEQLLNDPVKVEVTPESTTVERIDQRVLFVDKKNKPKLLKHLIESERVEQALVFTRTKHGANKVFQTLHKWGIPAAAIHGNKSQGARTNALNGFKSGKIQVLVATDIAARGIDIPGLSHVFNYDLPEVSESYVHRIGRTARAGKSGVAYAFCDASERGLLKSIERNIRVRIPIMSNHPFVPDAKAFAEVPAKEPSRPQRKKKKKLGFQGSDRSKPSRSSSNSRSEDESSRPRRQKKKKFFGPRRPRD